MNDVPTSFLPIDLVPFSMVRSQCESTPLGRKVAPEAPAERVICDLYETAVARWKPDDGIALSESYVEFCADVVRRNTGRRRLVETPTANEFSKHVKRRLKTIARREPPPLANFFESDLAPSLDEIYIEGEFLKSVLELIGLWNSLPKSKQKQILALSPLMVVVFDTRSKTIHDIRGRPGLADG